MLLKAHFSLPVKQFSSASHEAPHLLWAIKATSLMVKDGFRAWKMIGHVVPTCQARDALGRVCPFREGCLQPSPCVGTSQPSQWGMGVLDAPALEMDSHHDRMSKSFSSSDTLFMRFPLAHFFIVWLPRTKPLSSGSDHPTVILPAVSCQ